MSDDAMAAGPTPAPPEPLATALPKLDPETLVLRAKPRGAIRFKRGVIIGIAATAASLLAGVAWLALGPATPRGPAPVDLSNAVASQTPRDAVAGLPADYGAAKLGPPLPGDLGKPLLDARREMALQPSGAVPAGPTLADEKRARTLEAEMAARQSGLLAQTGGNSASQPAMVAAPMPDHSGQSGPAVPADPGQDPNAQGHKAAFVAAHDSGQLVNPHGLQAAASPNLLSAGSVIAASLITGVRSDLPGLVTAQVTENVYDSATGRTLLLPQGSRLIGTYDSVVAFGQKRALVVWQRIVLPDASSLRLDNVPATDPSGYSGLADKVDFHTWTLLKGVVVSTLLGVGSELALSGESDLVQAVRLSTQGNVSRAGDQLTSRTLQVQPTITIRPGAAVRLVVHRDLILQPWHG